MCACLCGLGILDSFRVEKTTIKSLQTVQLQWFINLRATIPVYMLCMERPNDDTCIHTFRLLWFIAIIVRDPSFISHCFYQMLSVLRQSSLLSNYTQLNLLSVQIRREIWHIRIEQIENIVHFFLWPRPVFCGEQKQSDVLNSQFKCFLHNIDCNIGPNRVTIWSVYFSSRVFS